MKSQSVTIDRIMTKNIETIESRASVKDAAAVMKKRDIGALPVQDNGALKGMLTDRDIAVRLVAEGRDPASTSVGDIMTTRSITCAPGDDVRAVEQEMERSKVRRVIVVDDRRQAIGVVSLGDIAVHRGTGEGGEVLEKVSEPAHSRGKV